MICYTVAFDCSNECESTVVTRSEKICCNFAGSVKKCTNNSRSFCNHGFVARICVKPIQYNCNSITIDHGRPKAWLLKRAPKNLNAF